MSPSLTLRAYRWGVRERRSNGRRDTSQGSGGDPKQRSPILGLAAHASELEGSRRRRFHVTRDGIAAVAVRREAPLNLWDGIEGG